MDYRRMPIEAESPEEFGYDLIECNLAESSVTDLNFSSFMDVDLSRLILAYGSHRGHTKLREAIAKEAGVEPDDVLLVPGAAGGLFIISTSLLEKNDELIVVHPNYATNLETPKAIGAMIHEVSLEFENGWKTTAAKLTEKLSSDTKLVSITTPHNPTGVITGEEEIEKIVSEVCEKNRKYLLVDETYRYLTFKDPGRVKAGLHEKVITVASVSKAFGLPGIRIGWIICRDKKLMEKFLAAKEQMVICNSVIDEEIAWQAFKDREKFLLPVKKHVEENFKEIENWLGDHKFLEWIRPEGGVVCFPRIRKEANIDVSRFYRLLNEEFKTWVGPGHWFGMPDEYMRIGFGYPAKDELVKGFKNIDHALGRSVK